MLRVNDIIGVIQYERCDYAWPGLHTLQLLLGWCLVASKVKEVLTIPRNFKNSKKENCQSSWQFHDFMITVITVQTCMLSYILHYMSQPPSLPPGYSPRNAVLKIRNLTVLFPAKINILDGLNINNRSWLPTETNVSVQQRFSEQKYVYKETKYLPIVYNFSLSWNTILNHDTFCNVTATSIR